MSIDNIEITLPLVKDLVAKQFPQWSNLLVKPIELSGWDHRTFHLGDEMLLRLPSAEGYAAQVLKEQKWLPKLAKCLNTKIPEPIAMGKPSKEYPWNFSIYNWIEGKSANSINLDDKVLEIVASQLAQFLNELHKVDTLSAPMPGAHNYYRGAHPSVYDKETRDAISNLKNIIDTKKALLVWEKAIESKWDKDPVWIHGDFSSGNILIKDNKLNAVIDFGCTGIGDPACDLVIAWTFLKNKSRDIFKSEIDIDNNTWNRARGWALWKALITLDSNENKEDAQALEQFRIINDVLNEYE